MRTFCGTGHKRKTPRGYGDQHHTTADRQPSCAEITQHVKRQVRWPVTRVCVRTKRASSAYMLKSSNYAPQCAGTRGRASGMFWPVEFRASSSASRRWYATVAAYIHTYTQHAQYGQAHIPMANVFGLARTEYLVASARRPVRENGEK